MQPVTQEDLETRFKHHKPKDQLTQDRHQLVRDKCKALAVEITRQTPPGREQALALTKLEEVMMWANAAIAREQPKEIPQ